MISLENLLSSIYYSRKPLQKVTVLGNIGSPIGLCFSSICDFSFIFATLPGFDPGSETAGKCFFSFFLTLARLSCPDAVLLVLNLKKTSMPLHCAKVCNTYPAFIGMVPLTVTGIFFSGPLCPVDNGSCWFCRQCKGELFLIKQVVIKLCYRFFGKVQIQWVVIGFFGDNSYSVSFSKSLCSLSLSYWENDRFSLSIKSISISLGLIPFLGNFLPRKKSPYGGFLWEMVHL